MTRRLTIRRESWPLAKPFTISRGTKTHAEVVVAEITDGANHARGEGVPYVRYGETVDGVVAQAESVADAIAAGIEPRDLQALLPPGAARNAVDCALWDLRAKSELTPIWRLIGFDAPHPVVTAYTLSLDSPAAMAETAAENAFRPLLKLKLGGGSEDLERVRAVRAGAPKSRLIVDANEAWSPEDFAALAPALAELGVALLEQPLPAGKDEALAHLPRPVPVCADESCHVVADLDRLAGRYDAVNVKLDKAGGLTEAAALVKEAKGRGLRVMIGCMVGTSLAMAPALVLASEADFVDLDGPLLLARDRQPGLRYEGSTVFPPKPNLWG
ncbi:MAG: dipeptide epimerase [Rhodospirillales bacterium]|nr:dipeptide epimerase [Rhodospirillales bacterium]